MVRQFDHVVRYPTSYERTRIDPGIESRGDFEPYIAPSTSSAGPITTTTTNPASSSALARAPVSLDYSRATITSNRARPSAPSPAPVADDPLNRVMRLSDISSVAVSPVVVAATAIATSMAQSATAPPPLAAAVTALKKATSKRKAMTPKRAAMMQALSDHYDERRGQVETLVDLEMAQEAEEVAAEKLLAAQRAAGEMLSLPPPAVTAQVPADTWRNPVTAVAARIEGDVEMEEEAAEEAAAAAAAPKSKGGAKGAKKARFAPSARAVAAEGAQEPRRSKRTAAEVAAAEEDCAREEHEEVSVEEPSAKRAKTTHAVKNGESAAAKPSLKVTLSVPSDKLKDVKSKSSTTGNACNRVTRSKAQRAQTPVQETSAPVPSVSLAPADASAQAAPAPARASKRKQAALGEADDTQGPAKRSKTSDAAEPATEASRPAARRQAKAKTVKSRVKSATAGAPGTSSSVAAVVDTTSAITTPAVPVPASAAAAYAPSAGLSAAAPNSAAPTTIALGDGSVFVDPGRGSRALPSYIGSAPNTWVENARTAVRQGDLLPAPCTLASAWMEQHEAWAPTYVGYSKRGQKVTKCSFCQAQNRVARECSSL